MSAPQIGKALMKGVIYAGAFFVISESELPDTIADSVKKFNREYLIQTQNLRPSTPEQRKECATRLAAERNQRKQDAVLQGSLEENSWSKPLIWFSGSSRLPSLSEEQQWKVVGKDGKVVSEENVGEKVAAEKSSKGSEGCGGKKA